MAWIICDIDGTLTDPGHRLHLLPNPEAECEQDIPASWDEFNRSAAYDTCKEPIREIIRMARNSGHGIVLMTGRMIKYADITLQWLRENDIIYNRLYMRPNHDLRSDVEVKKMLLDRFAKDYGFANPQLHVLFVLEDRDKMCEMWRSLGFTCLQVEKGRY